MSAASGEQVEVARLRNEGEWAAAERLLVEEDTPQRPASGRPYDVPGDCDECDGWHADGECPQAASGRRPNDA